MRKEVPDLGNPMIAKSSIQDMSCMTFPFLSSMSLSGGIVIVVSFLDLVVAVVVISFIESAAADLASMLLYTDDGLSRCRPHRKVMVRMKK